ncbi:hypothetical protein RN001_007113 [Aquatica leii]|uniref:DDE Tnp4 domain-containing protein n=1 Tax=Aquatica leii TaxID=1421715 RepID=A0AAN7P7Y1_9COLE|nr:hypothetical protein RN001_007113 [Aquatica leii]
MDYEEMLLVIIIDASASLLVPNYKRRCWVKPWIQKRNNCYENIHLLYNELATGDKNSFQNFIKMDEHTFQLLLSLVRSDIEKEDTLTITLLATEESYKSLFYSFRVGHSTISEIVPEVNGKISDRCVFRNSTLAAAIATNKLNFPEETPLPGRSKPVPYAIVADAAFPLSHHILKPFPFRNMTATQCIFNYRLSKARRLVENSFDMVANIFRILLNTVNLYPKKVKTITLACVVLHNFLRTTTPNTYNIQEKNDRRLRFQYALSRQAENKANQSALNNRQEFLEYVNGVGAVDWQNNLSYVMYKTCIGIRDTAK